MAPLSKLFGGGGASSSSSTSSNTSSSSSQPPPSPFFQPSTPFQVRVVQTPGGSQHQQRVPKQAAGEDEHKSSILGCVANLSNAIVGSGIVGIPFAIQQSGFCTGVVLVVLCAVLTEKSLRILIETAKHVQVPTYETLSEAVFGHFGFYFITINMFFLAYGAMTSYLMIVKDTFGRVLGLESIAQRRALLFCISLLVIVPLSSLRDMADLSQTSRFNVIFDITMVLIVVYIAPMSTTVQDHGGMWPILSNSLVPHWNTVFVGLGVLSFAFVCQHSAFIIAGSLQQPTRRRWQMVTRIALSLCSCLAILCGTCGYLGYFDHTQGNILNNLQSNPVLSNTARTLLGTTMLFVYPMESFVARHVCVVLLFQGRRAHEGEDSTILSRRDRRITLTLSLYLMALVPATLFENLGHVLAATGAVGGSCISYIGVGAVYLGVYGAEFVQLVHPWRQHVLQLQESIQQCCWWCKGSRTSAARDENHNTTTIVAPKPTQQHGMDEGSTDVESTALIQQGNSSNTPKLETTDGESTLSYMRLWIEWMGWYLVGMPLWHWMATLGNHNLTLHRQAMATKSPHLSRIDSRVGGGHAPRPINKKQQQQHVSKQRPLRRKAMDDIQEEDHHDNNTAAAADDGDIQTIIKRGGLIGGSGGGRDVDGLTLHGSLRGINNVGGRIVVRSDSDFIPGTGTILPPKSGNLTASYQQQQTQQHGSLLTPKRPIKGSANTDIYNKNINANDEEDKDEETNHDPPPTPIDFVIAIGYMLFGVVALIVGLLSLFYSGSSS